MRLTPNQQETLHEVVVGHPGGQLLKPIPSLIERGLVTTVTIPGVYHEPTRSWVHPPQTAYRLTPLGLEEYTKLCVTRRAAAWEGVEATLRDNIAQAQARTRARLGPYSTADVATSSATPQRWGRTC